LGLLQAKLRKNQNEGRILMKTMGKWTVTLFMVTLLAGCFGGGYSSSQSSDEGPIAAREHPSAGLWKVTLNPRGQSITFEPVTKAATGYPVGIVYSEPVALAGIAATALAHTRVVNGSAQVCSVSMG